MSNKPYDKIGKTYYPKGYTKKVENNEVKGAAWRFWAENGQYYYEYDAGHFSTKLKVAKISKDDFEAIKEGRISNTKLTHKYG